MSATVMRHHARRAEPTVEHPPRLRRFLQGLGLAGLVAVAAWGARQVADPGFMPLRGVRLVGHFQHLDTARVEGVIRDTVRGNFINANVDQVRGAVEALPWVDGASVQRRWPDTLEVSVVEQRPLARWDEQRLVAADGEVFDGQVDTALPVFRGPDAAAGGDMVAAYRDMQKVLAPLGLDVRRLSLSERRAWQATLSNGIHLVIGRHQRHQRLVRFAAVYGDALAGMADRIQGVDLRYTNGFAVRWRDAAARRNS